MAPVALFIISSDLMKPGNHPMQPDPLCFCTNTIPIRSLFCRSRGWEKG